MILYKKVLGKKSSNKWKCIIQNGKKVLFSRFFFSSDLFSSGLFSWDLISWDFIGSPHTILEKKSQESKIQDFISSDIFCKVLRKFGLFSKVFISRNFFPGTFLHRFTSRRSTTYSCLLIIDRKRFWPKILYNMQYALGVVPSSYTVFKN